MGDCSCPGVSEDHAHTPSSGKDTKATETYTDMMVIKVHSSFAKIIKPKQF